MLAEHTFYFILMNSNYSPFFLIEIEHALSSAHKMVGKGRGFQAMSVRDDDWCIF